MSKIRIEGRKVHVLLEPQSQKSTREVVRDTFTPSRVGLLSWAFAAVVMGTVGLASYQFGSRDAQLALSNQTITGVPLPAAGPIETTASIARSGRAQRVEVLELPRPEGNRQAADVSQSQIEVLQKEIVGLRRRLSALSEQNIAYSRRIAALEEDVTASRLAATGDQPATGTGSLRKTVPSPGVVMTSAEAQPTNQSSPSAVIPPRKKLADAGKTPPVGNTASGTRMETPKTSGSQVPPSRVTLQSSQQPAPVSPPSTLKIHEPVRIVELPEAEGAPIVTGSIPPGGSSSDQPEFDATPTTTTPKPAIIMPSDPAGRLRGSGDMTLKRSDFGAVIGRYRDLAAAAKAWADFKEQNEERMRDLRPLTVSSQSASGGVALMVGPFANAADAAVACLHLLDVTELCHPAIFSGDPLIAAAEFRDTAF